MSATRALYSIRLRIYIVYMQFFASFSIFTFYLLRIKTVDDKNAKTTHEYKNKISQFDIFSHCLFGRINEPNTSRTSINSYFAFAKVVYVRYVAMAVDYSYVFEFQFYIYKYIFDVQLRKEYSVRIEHKLLNVNLLDVGIALFFHRRYQISTYQNASLVDGLIYNINCLLLFEKLNRKRMLRGIPSIQKNKKQKANSANRNKFKFEFKINRAHNEGKWHDTCICDELIKYVPSIERQIYRKH